MSHSEAIAQHLQLCEELHQLTLEENRYLKSQQTVPSSPMLERHRDLLVRLEASIEQLKTPENSQVPHDSDERAQRAAAIEKARSRILQILHLHKENEELILRYSMGAPRLARPLPAPTSAARLQKLYNGLK